LLDIEDAARRSVLGRRSEGLKVAYSRQLVLAQVLFDTEHRQRQTKMPITASQRMVHCGASTAGRYEGCA